MRTSLFDRNLINLEAMSGHERFQEYPPHAIASLTQCRDRILNCSYDREGLADCLADYNHEIGNDERALSNVERLRDDRATVVVTGQQAGLFSGPLYTIYKAITAIELAALKEERSGCPVIPIFWNATEDHDLSEVANCQLPGALWEADFGVEGVAAETLSTQAVNGILDDFIESLPDHHKDELNSLLACPYDDYGVYSSAVLARLFADTGLVVLEPRILRKDSVSFFRNCVRRRNQIREALALSGKELSNIGIGASFDPGNGFGLFHITSCGVRRQVLEESDGFLVDGRHVSEEELLRLIDSTPHSFSTGAFLRPVLQALLLPNVAYVAGPGEFRYHLQLRDVYRGLDAVMPVLWFRNHATLLGAREQRIAQKLGLADADLFRNASDFHHSVELPAELEASFATARTSLDEAADALDPARDLVGKRSIGAFVTKAQSELEKVRKRAGREVQRKSDVDNARIDKLFQCVAPGNTIQERRINIFYFLAQEGAGLIKDLLATFDPAERRHYICRLD